MNRPPTANIELEHERAALARRAEREGHSGPTAPAVDAARWLHRAIVAAPVPCIPNGFAARVAGLAGDFAEKAEIEDRIQRIVLVIAALLALVVGAPGLLAGLRTIATLTLIPAGQSAALFATALALALAALIDAAFKRQQRRSDLPALD